MRLAVAEIAQIRQIKKSQQRGLNSRPFAYEATALPLSYAGLAATSTLVCFEIPQCADL